MIEFVFPGTVVLMKLAFRNAVGRAFDPAEFAKSLLAFPVDISFLGLSFAAISLSHVQNATKTALDIRVSFATFAACVVLLIIQQAMCKASDEHLDKSQYIIMGLTTFLSYAVSMLVIVCSLMIGGVL